jgi:hypothetical protein
VSDARRRRSGVAGGWGEVARSPASRARRAALALERAVELQPEALHADRLEPDADGLHAVRIGESEPNS